MSRQPSCHSNGNLFNRGQRTVSAGLSWDCVTGWRQCKRGDAGQYVGTTGTSGDHRHIWLLCSLLPTPTRLDCSSDLSTNVLIVSFTDPFLFSGVGRQGRDTCHTSAINLLSDLFLPLCRAVAFLPQVQMVRGRVTLNFCYPASSHQPKFTG